MLKSALAATILTLLALAGQQFWQTVSSTDTRTDHRVNLALRRTGHGLLASMGNDTSRVPVIKKLDAQTFLLELNQAFVYDSLPAILQASLALHQLPNTYDVALLDCQTREVQLGYHSFDYLKDGVVPCKGRQQNTGCYALKITFALPPKSFATLWACVALAGVLGVGWGAWQYRQQKVVQKMPQKSINLPRITIGRSSLELTNLLLHVDEDTHTLTYREAKLLQLFAKYPNQVLERDFILQAVWGDEGVTVGRSVDVFVSRLRKLLHADTTLKIAAVHGVGYRFEVSIAPLI